MAGDTDRMKMKKDVIDNLKGAVSLSVLIPMAEDGFVDFRPLHLLFQLVDYTEHVPETV
jgi:hypothetical protein